MAEIDAFVDAVETGEQPEVSFEDGRRALILAEAAYKSLSEKRLVQVSEIAAEVRLVRARVRAARNTQQRRLIHAGK